ncbi:MAG: hypothetical protein IT214_07160 [Chitinophagaceae bacterium]|nr:hypothetical protein [Chitinophagaceae bacterium]
MRTLLTALLMAACISPVAAQDELPAISKSNRNDFFIADVILQKYNLKTGQTDEWMKVYNNLSDNGSIQRANDIRWQAQDKETAQKWYRENTSLLGEGGREITSMIPKPVGVDEWNVYGESESMQKMIKSLGLDQNQYFFTFSVDQYVAKIFVATSSQLSVQDAWKFAKEGLRATLIAAGKKTIAGLLL